MPRRGSILAKFIWNALPVKKNSPNLMSPERNACLNKPYCNLDWVDEETNIWCLICMHMNNKGWRKEHGRIFEDWHKLRPRKVDNADMTKKRQRFLVALKKCKNFKRLEERCTSTEFYYQFVDCDKIDGKYSFDPGPSLSPPQCNVDAMNSDLCVSSNCDAEGTNLNLEQSDIEMSCVSLLCSEIKDMEQGHLSPSIDSESGYGSEMEENLTIWFEKNFTEEELNAMLNCSNKEPATSASGGMVSKQPFNETQLNETTSTVKVNISVDDFVDLIKKSKTEPSGNCITLTVPSDVLNRLQDASKII